MDKDKIKELSYLIAEFDGLVPKDHILYKEWPNQQIFPEKEMLYNSIVFKGQILCVENWVAVNDLKFDSSFDWLLPVAKKCLSMSCDGRQHIYTALHEIDINHLFLAVADYILWFKSDASIKFLTDIGLNFKYDEMQRWNT
jgi:hypothetical protein